MFKGGKLELKEAHIFYIQPQILTLNNVEDKMKIFFNDICLNKKIKQIIIIFISLETILVTILYPVTALFLKFPS